MNGEEDRIESLHRVHTAEVASQLAQTRAELLEKQVAFERELRRVYRIGGAVAVVSIALSIAFVSWRLFAIVEHELALPAIRHAIYAEINAPLQRLEERMVRIDERERINALLDKAIGADDGEAYAMLMNWSRDDPSELGSIVRAAQMSLEAYLRGGIWSYNGSEIKNVKAPEDLEILHSSEDPWQRVVAGRNLANWKSAQERAVGDALFRAITTDQSALVRYWSWYSFSDRFGEKLNKAGLTWYDRAKVEALVRELSTEAANAPYR